MRCHSAHAFSAEPSITALLARLKYEIKISNDPVTKTTGDLHKILSTINFYLDINFSNIPAYQPPESESTCCFC